MAGFIPQAPASASSTHPGHGKAPYKTYHASHRYQTNYGIVGLPVARKHQPGKQSLRPVRLHAPVTHRVLTIVVARHGDWPEVPRAEPLEGEVLVDRVVAPYDPELIENGRTRLFQLEVTYIFLCLTAKEETDNLPVGVCPWDSQGQGDMPASAFTSRIAAK